MQMEAATREHHPLGAFHSHRGRGDHADQFPFRTEKRNAQYLKNIGRGQGARELEPKPWLFELECDSKLNLTQRAALATRHSRDPQPWIRDSMKNQMCYRCFRKGGAGNRMTNCVGASFAISWHQALMESRKGRSDGFSEKEKEAIDAKLESPGTTCDRSFHQKCLAREDRLAHACTLWTKNATTGLYASMPMT